MSLSPQTVRGIFAGVAISGGEGAAAGYGSPHSIPFAAIPVLPMEVASTLQFDPSAGLWVGVAAASVGAAFLAVKFGRKRFGGSTPAVIPEPMETPDDAETQNTPESPEPPKEVEPPPPKEADLMSIVKLEAPKQFELRLEGGAVKLPAICIVPTDPRNVPLSPTIAFQVHGRPGGFARLIEQEYVKLAEQYRPPAVKKSHTFEPTGLKTNDVLPAASVLTLHAVLSYRMTDAGGETIAGPPVEVFCQMQAGDNISAWREITLEPKVLVLSQGAIEESSIRIKVRSFNNSVARIKAMGPTSLLPKPTLRMSRETKAAIKELPGLLEHLMQASSAIRFVNPAAGPDSADGIQEYVLSARLDLSDHERKLLADMTRDRSLTLPLAVHAPGALPSALTVEVESVVGQFPGQFAVDFGTSNSTITIYEPKIITPRPLPVDQLEELRDQFAHWLDKSPNKALNGVAADEFEEFASSVARNLNPEPNELALDTLRKRFRPDSSDRAVERMHEAIRQIELAVPQQKNAARRALRVKLHDIYAETFRAFPFRQYNLTTLPLEGSSLDMSSELEVVATQPRLRVRMGSDVREAREAFEIVAPAAAGVNGAAARPDAADPSPAEPKAAVAVGDDPIVEKRFHRVPKRYLSELNRESPGSVRVVRQSGARDLVEYAQIVGAAWDHLRSRFDDVRAKFPDVYSKGRVRRAVVTYPTVLGPKARNEVVKLFHDMGIPTVRMVYDEAVAAAIFHLEKFFGGSYEVGPEAFKTRCRRQSEVWVQNMLVLDIGGGTTDLALIRLEMKQETFKGADQGAGGRYYTITPTLLGSSGNEYLGGELITLRTFRLLKLALADYVLQNESALNYPPDLVKARTAVLAMISPNQAYEPGSLLERIAADRNDPGLQAALEAADTILPTRFLPKPTSRRAFQALWREAEKIKLELGRRRKVSPGETDLPLQHSLEPSTIAAFLSTAWNEPGGPFKVNDKAPPLTLTSEMFERVASPIIQQALKIALGLSESALRKYEQDHPQSDSVKREKLDRIVLSGKSCNLHLVHDLLPQTLHGCSYYGDDVTEILFEEKLAKQATSVGACRAEEMWASLRPPDGWEATSGTGVSSVAFNIRNLFFFLPCSFWLKDQSEQPTVRIFTVNDRYLMLDGSSMGKIRSNTPSEWTPPQHTTRVYRIDYEGHGGLNWGNYYLDSLGRTLGRSTEELQENLRVRFEIDHDTLIQILLCHRGKPRYTFDGRSITVGDADLRPKLAEMYKAAGKGAAVIPLQGSELEFDIAIDPVDDNPAIVLKAGSPFDLEAREPLPSLEGPDPAAPPILAKTTTATPASAAGKDKGVRFALSGPLPKPRTNRRYDFYARAAGAVGQKWVHLGSVQLPREKGGFEENWHAAVSQNGYVRVMQGMPDYWIARTPEDLFDHPGTVLYEKLQADQSEADPDVNPDSGIH